MDNDNDGKLVGNTIRGTNVSKPSHSERSAQEDNAYTVAPGNGHNRQILARMEKILWECKSIDQLIDTTTKMPDSLLEVPGVQRAVCKRSQMIACTDTFVILKSRSENMRTCLRATAPQIECSLAQACTQGDGLRAPRNSTIWQGFVRRPLFLCWRNCAMRAPNFQGSGG